MSNLEIILDRYTNHEATLEETNEALIPYGIHLDPDGAVSGWTEAEMAEGFIEADETAPLPDVAEFQTCIPALAGQTITVKTRQGVFEIRYKADGYHEVSKLVK